MDNFHQSSLDADKRHFFFHYRFNIQSACSQRVSSIKRLARHAKSQSYSNTQLESTEAVLVSVQPQVHSSVNPLLPSPPGSTKIKHDFVIAGTTHIKANSQDSKMVVSPSIVKIDSLSSSSNSLSDFTDVEHNQKLAGTESYTTLISSSSRLEPANSPYSVTSTHSSLSSIKQIPSLFQKKLLAHPFSHYCNVKHSRSTSSISATYYNNNINEWDNNTSISTPYLNSTAFSALKSTYSHKKLHIFSFGKHFSKNLKKYKNSSNSTSQCLQKKVGASSQSTNVVNIDKMLCPKSIVDVQLSLLEAIKVSTGCVPETELMYCVDGSQWIQGSGSVATDSFLTLHDKTHDVKTIFNLRASSIDLSLEEAKIITICFPSENDKSQKVMLDLLVNTSSSIMSIFFCDWIATLLIHSHLKLGGLKSRSYYPFTLNHPAPHKQQNSLAEILIESSVEFTKDNNENMWILANARLRDDGILDFTNINNGNTCKINLQDVKACDIFEVFNSILSQRYVINIITENNHMNSLGSFFIKLKTKTELNKWLYSLKAVARPHVYTTATGSPLTSIRISRTLNLCIIKAKLNLSIVHKYNNSNCEMFVRIILGNQRAMTCKTEITKAPIWLEDFQFNNLTEDTIPEIILELWSHNYETDESRISGYLKLNEQSVRHNSGLEAWYKIKSVDLEDSDFGQLCIKTSVDEIKVAHNSHYRVVRDALEDLSFDIKYLFAFNNDETINAGLSVTNDVVLNLAIASSDSLLATCWISALITQEIDKVRDFIVEKQGMSCFHEGCSKKQEEFWTNLNNTLFRGNSLLTHALEKYMRIIGNEHLEATVGNFVRNLISQEPNLEINPNKIDGENDPNDVAENHQKALLKNISKLWDIIQTSVHELPMALKFVFGHLSTELETKLHKSPSSIQVYVGGFLFLRFFCPALLNPKLFFSGLGICTCATNIQRSLTLITKILMCFVNHSRFGLKEPWMFPMNTFIDDHSHELNKYFDKVILKLDEQQRIDSSTLVSSASTFAERDFFAFVNERVGNSPLSEIVNNKFMIDETAASARLVDIWKTYLAPNRTNFFEKLAAATNPVEDDANSVLAKFERFYEACDQAWTSSRQVINHLMNKADEFDPAATEWYARHINLSWTGSSIENKRKGQPYIKLDHTDWLITPTATDSFTDNKASDVAKSSVAGAAISSLTSLSCATKITHAHGINADYEDKDDSTSIHSVFCTAAIANSLQSMVTDNTDFALGNERGKITASADNTFASTKINTKEAYPSASVVSGEEATGSTSKDRKPRLCCSVPEDLFAVSPNLSSSSSSLFNQQQQQTIYTPNTQ